MSLFLMNNRLYAIGHNSFSKLGLGHNNYIETPTEVPGLPEIRKIYSFKKYSVLIDINNDMWVCGSNTDNQFCISEKSINVFRKSMSNVYKVAKSRKLLLILCYNGILYASGRQINNPVLYNKFTEIQSQVEDIKHMGNSIFLIKNGKTYVSTKFKLVEIGDSGLASLTKKDETYAKSARNI
jgi:alpha-tubulin suppressor-like RCC1 family protein